jgi:putative hydrolase of the HAD superfamily
MIDTIIFDFGNIFINLDEVAYEKGFKEIGIDIHSEAFITISKTYERGKIDELEFIQKLIPLCNTDDLLVIRNTWNSILLDFPLRRLEFAQMIGSQFQLFLLSNTNATHIDKFEHKEGQSFARDFYSCFEKVYFSFEIGKIKPDESIYRYVINNHNLIPKKTLFVDDKIENIEGAKLAGLQTWQLDPKTEDVTELLNFLKKMNA